MAPACMPSNIPRKQSHTIERLNKMDHTRYPTRRSRSSNSNLPETLRRSMHYISEERSPPLPHLTDDDPPPDPIDPYGSRTLRQTAAGRLPGGPNRLAIRKSMHAPAKRLPIDPKKHNRSPEPSQPEEPPIEPYGRDWDPWRP